MNASSCPTSLNKRIRQFHRRTWKKYARSSGYGYMAAVHSREAAWHSAFGKCSDAKYHFRQAKKNVTKAEKHRSPPWSE